MPINTTGRNNPRDYFVGRGSGYVAELGANDVPGGYRFIGNAPGVAFTGDSETAEHFSSLSGVTAKDAEVIVRQSAGFTLSVDEFNFQNWALFSTGKIASYANASQAGVANMELVVSPGFYYEIFDQAAKPTTDYHSARLYDLGVVTVTGDGGTPTYVAGVDYEVDLTMGIIFIIPGGAITASTTIEIDVAAKAGGAALVDEMQALTDVQKIVAFKFIGLNINNNDKKVEFQVFKTKLRPNGEIPVVTETDFATIPLIGTIEKSTLAQVGGSSFYTLRELP